MLVANKKSHTVFPLPHFSTARWYGNYRHRNKVAYWCHILYTDSARVHAPTAKDNHKTYKVSVA